MAYTVLADVIQPVIYDKYVREQTIYKNEFIRAGIVKVDSGISTKLAQGNKTFNVPFWKDLTNDDEVPREDADLTAYNITADKSIGVKQWRSARWGANAFSAQLSGSTPAQAIAAYEIDWWNRKMQANLISLIRGVIADNVANDSSDLVKDISIEDGNNATSANLVSSDSIIDANFLFGDSYNDITAIAMHSNILKRLIKANLIDFEKTSDQSMTIQKFMGRTVIVDDNIYTPAGSTSGYKYWSILFKAGAILYGDTTEGYVSTEIDRDPNRGGGIDYLYSQRVFCYHPQGFKWLGGTLTYEYPTNANLTAANNWDRVYNKKNCGFCILITNG